MPTPPLAPLPRAPRRDSNFPSPSALWSSPEVLRDPEEMTGLPTAESDP